MQVAIKQVSGTFYPVIRTCKFYDIEVEVSGWDFYSIDELGNLDEYRHASDNMGDESGYWSCRACGRSGGDAEYLAHVGKVIG